MAGAGRWGPARRVRRGSIRFVTAGLVSQGKAWPGLQGLARQAWFGPERMAGTGSGISTLGVAGLVTHFRPGWGRVFLGSVWQAG